MTAFAELVLAGDIQIHIDRSFTLDEVPEALAYVGEGRAVGKVVIDVSGTASRPR